MGTQPLLILPSWTKSTLVSCGLTSPGHRVPRVRPRLPSVCVWARPHKQCNVRAPPTRRPRTSIYGVTPAEVYLLFNLFVEGPQQSCSSRPRGAGGQVRVPL